MDTTRRLRTLAPLALAAALAAAACNGTSTGESLIDVTLLDAVTVLPDGSTAAAGSFIVGDGHRYRVRATITLDPGATFDPSDTGVSILYIDPGTGAERTASVAPAAGDPTAYAFDLPGSEDLDLCQPMFYRWSAVYDITDGARGVYLGEPRYVLPSQHRPTPNTIQQALCQAPSTSPWGDL